MSNDNKKQQQLSPAARQGIVVYEDRNDRDNIRIENLSVRVPGRDEPLIRDVNMVIPRGARVLVTGESGSGKTTLVKAILKLWNYGDGVVAMPEGMNVMTIPQVVYLPNVPLRNILNMRPEGEDRFDNRAMRDALLTVKLDHLVQHIPGQQVQILMDGVLSLIDKNLSAAQGAEPDLQPLRSDIDAAITRMTAEQFEVVQYVRDEERDYFKSRLKTLLETKPAATAAAVAQWSDSIIDKIDVQLAQPLVAGLRRGAPAFAAEAQKWHILPYSMARAGSFAAGLQRDMDKRLSRYIRNEDTEDPSREVRLNKRQAEHISATFARAVGDALLEPVQKSALRYAFNAVSLPVRLCARLWAGSPVGGRLMKDLVYSISNFMEKQIVRGDALSSRLSGGQKKMLMAACVLLARPQILLLDEIPSGLDAMNGLRLYKDIMHTIPQDATVISIIHNEEQFVPFHTHHARVAEGTVKVAPIARPAP